MDQQKPKAERHKLTVLIDADMQHRLEQQRRDIESREGVRVSMTQIAERAMRAGLVENASAKN